MTKLPPADDCCKFSILPAASFQCSLSSIKDIVAAFLSLEHYKFVFPQMNSPFDIFISSKLQCACRTQPHEVLPHIFVSRAQSKGAHGVSGDNWLDMSFMANEIYQSTNTQMT